MTSVIDASVVLAWLQDEPGAEDAEPLIMDGVIGAANWSEVLQKARQHGVAPEMVARLLASFGLTVADVTRADGAAAADLWASEMPLSLGDRLCMALGIRMGLTVATMDAAWSTVEDGPTILVLR